jgi:hypothetical protein
MEYILSVAAFRWSRIFRAITDQSLKSSLYKVLPQHIPAAWKETADDRLNPAFVCTTLMQVSILFHIANVGGEQSLGYQPEGCEGKILPFFQASLSGHDRSRGDRTGRH